MKTMSRRQGNEVDKRSTLLKFVSDEQDTDFAIM